MGEKIKKFMIKSSIKRTFETDISRTDPKIGK
jgi:hypothetical protein